jgi:hypothetical protein
MDDTARAWDAKLWDLFVELRKEIIESQKIRAQIIGFKITFISTAIGLILANGNRGSQMALVVPAFAAIFFDFLIQSYSFSIKRIGRYCGEHLEPVIFPKNTAVSFPSWEEFMSSPQNRQNYSMIGNLGITVLAVIPAITALCAPFRLPVSLPILFVLISFLTVDGVCFLTTGRYGRQQSSKGASFENDTRTRPK